MGKFKIIENSPLTDVKRTENYNPEAVITKQPPVFFDDRNIKGETFNTWLQRMNTEIYLKYGVPVISWFGSKSENNLDKLELKDMFYKNMESNEFYREIKDYLDGVDEKK